MHEEDFIDIIHDDIKQATGCLSVRDFKVVKPLEEADIMHLLEKHGDLITCFNCGEKLTEVQGIRLNDHARARFIAKLILDPGQSHYPVEPDEPAGICFICAECDRIGDKNQTPTPTKHI